MNTLTATNILLGLLAQQQRIATLLRTAQTEGRDITSDELDAVMAEASASLRALDDDIAAARAGGG